MGPFVGGWHLIYTKPQHEMSVSRALSEIKIEFYLPFRSAIRKWHDRRKIIQIPLFPSYIFVFLRNLQDYCHGLQIRGALQYVGFGNEVARVDDKTIKQLKMFVGNENELEVSAGRIQPGRQFIVNGGPFVGMPCEVVESNNSLKVLIRIQLLNRNVLITVPPCYLTKTP